MTVFYSDLVMILESGLTFWATLYNAWSFRLAVGWAINNLMMMMMMMMMIQIIKQDGDDKDRNQMYEISAIHVTN